MDIPPKVLVLIGTLLAVAGLATFIASIATSDWMTTLQVRGSDIDTGLFDVCYEGHCISVEKVPELWDSYSGEFKAIRAMVILAIIATFIGLCVTGLLAFVVMSGRSNYKLAFAVGIAYLFAFVFGMIAIGVFKGNVFDEIDDDLSYMGYSYYLCLGGGVAAQIAADLMIYGGSRL